MDRIIIKNETITSINTSCSYSWMYIWQYFRKILKKSSEFQQILWIKLDEIIFY